MTPTLVLTRPEAQSREIAAALGGSVPVIVSPVMRIAAAGPVPRLDGYAGVILTSANALDFVPRLDDVPAWCVGVRTADAARAAGADLRLVATDAEEFIARFDGAGPLLHLRGEHARGKIAERLSLAGTETDEAVIYRQERLPLSGAALAALSGAAPVILPLYSPRSARLVGAQIDRVGPNVGVIAMSPAVAQAWNDETGGDAAVVDTPTGTAMLDAIRAALRG
ncbi:uroporphyrinogen-III synthase [Sinisalibacter aestuarii]|uniref:Uroporphyrinogen III methyltransferase n=1 Tax=Sinisalibacter aestuarii TaxID=2949426 RepID=A0ABQ5LNB4_9RHOB|nr:uroporphyrinogen-III synthase [Sinisalibacter aestuarii]GKY86502.1 uroporphyrinogen III methyltransferase [Sinisalibacter aestuarii]